MTQSIDRDTRVRASRTPTDEPVTSSCTRTIWGTRIATGAFAVGGVGLGVADVAGGPALHLVGVALTCLVLAGLGSAVLLVHAMLADRQEFYRRGQLDGWMRGWRGQEPEADDPLLR